MLEAQIVVVGGINQLASFYKCVIYHAPHSFTFQKISWLSRKLLLIWAAKVKLFLFCATFLPFINSIGQTSKPYSYWRFFASSEMQSQTLLNNQVIIALGCFLLVRSSNTKLVIKFYWCLDGHLDWISMVKSPNTTFVIKFSFFSPLDTQWKTTGYHSKTLKKRVGVSKKCNSHSCRHFIFLNSGDSI